MSRNDKISIIFGIVFFALFLYFMYIIDYLYALGWLILSIAFFLESYNPRDLSSREVLVLIDVILPFIAIGIIIYRFIYV